MIDPIEAFKQANSLVALLFPPTSRYHGLPAAQITRSDGSTVAYIRRRFVPPPERFTVLEEHEVAAEDRLDNLAARYLGDPLQFWRICDANRAVRPAGLSEVAGRRLLITLPEGIPGFTDAP